MKDSVEIENISFMYTNADCLLNKMDELQTRVQEEEPHIIAIAEYNKKTQDSSSQSQS